MTRQYVSDIVTKEEVAKWKPGSRILICSQTGSGKSNLVKENLYEYAKSHNKKILLMSNRTLLKNQNSVDLEGKEDIIKAHNYQEFETRIMHGSDIDELFYPYYFIVFDEAHYFYTDSLFNENTDLLIAPIKNTPKNKVFIFMSATPDALLDYQPNYDYTYNFPHDYSYIKNIHFYNKSPRNNIVESIINNIPKGDKLIYFGSKAKDIFNLSIKFNNSAFICSKGNEIYDKCDLNTLSQIVNNAKFEADKVFSTRLLDNGVNLKDDKLKHVIIDISDPITFIQILGRKRCMHKNDQIDLYVRNYHPGNIYYIINDFNRRIKSLDELDDFYEEDLLEKYYSGKIEEYDNDDEKSSVSKYQHYVTQRRLMLDILDNWNKDGYKKYICKMLKFDINKIKNANAEFENFGISSLLEKYTGFKMFRDEQDIFRDSFFSNIFSPKKTDCSVRGIKAISSIIDEDNLSYDISSRREKKGVNRDKYYWIVEKREDENKK
jgi:hypothetical protein